MPLHLFHSLPECLTLQWESFLLSSWKRARRGRLRRGGPFIKNKQKKQPLRWFAERCPTRSKQDDQINKTYHVVCRQYHQAVVSLQGDMLKSHQPSCSARLPGTAVLKHSVTLICDSCRFAMQLVTAPQSEKDGPHRETCLNVLDLAFFFGLIEGNGSLNAYRLLRFR